MGAVVRSASRLVRWSIAGALLLVAAVSLTWPGAPVHPFPRTCRTIANPRAPTDPSAPATIQLCSPAAPTDLDVVAWIAVVLLLLAPDLSELSIAQVVTLKRRVDAQADQLDAHSELLHATQAQLTAIATQIHIGASATAAVYVATQSPESVTSNVEAGRLEPARAAAARIALRDILRAAANAPPFGSADFLLYLRVPDRDLLAPLDLDRATSDLDVFHIGAGATGQAWSQRTTLVVTGEQARDATYGLTGEQQEHYAALTIAGATPVWSPDERLAPPLAVLTVASTEPIERDQGRVARAWGEHLEKLAETVAVILTDVLRLRSAVA